MGMRMSDVREPPSENKPKLSNLFKSIGRSKKVKEVKQAGIPARMPFDFPFGSVDF